MNCPKCGADMSRKGFLNTRSGQHQRWLCKNGHNITEGVGYSRISFKDTPKKPCVVDIDFHTSDKKPTEITFRKTRKKPRLVKINFHTSEEKKDE